MTQAEIDYQQASKDLKGYEDKMSFANRMGKAKKTGLGLSKKVNPIRKGDDLIQKEMDRIQKQKANPYRANGINVDKNTGDTLGAFFERLFK